MAVPPFSHEHVRPTEDTKAEFLVPRSGFGNVNRFGRVHIRLP
jgi:hypothetical protein